MFGNTISFSKDIDAIEDIVPISIELSKISKYRLKFTCIYQDVDAYSPVQENPQPFIFIHTFSFDYGYNKKQLDIFLHFGSDCLISENNYRSVTKLLGHEIGHHLGDHGKNLGIRK